MFYLLCSVTFAKSDVVLTGDSPMGFNGDVKISFYVSLEGKDTTSDGNKYAVPKDTLSSKSVFKLIYA